MPNVQTPVTLTQKIMDAACQYYDISLDELKTREHVDKKKVVQFLLRREACQKYKRIAVLFGQRAHYRVQQNIEDIDAQQNVNRSISTDIKNIKLLAGICE